MHYSIFIGLNNQTRKDFVIAERSKRVGTIKGILSIVENYFKANIVEEGRNRTYQRQRELFYYLCFDVFQSEFINSARTQIYKRIGEAVKRDRTNVYHFKRLHENGFYKRDTFLMNDDYFCNHYFNLKEIIEAVDYSDKKIKLERKEFKSSFEVIFENKRNFILNDLRYGATLKEINDSYFGYADDSHFRRMLKIKKPAVKRLLMMYRRKKK